MSTRTPGFKGEYLWELDIAEHQLLLLAEAFPADSYGWRAAESARSVSEILVHVAAGNFMLLGTVGVEAAPDLYGKLDPAVVPRMLAMITRNEELEKNILDRAAVIALMKRSLAAWRSAFTQASDAELERQDTLFGERTTVRRMYMRGLTHMHEHMGQLIAYTRAIGLPAPWPDWREAGKKMIQRGVA
jgi:uncharacterized damage-inducible protein DinB